MSISPGIWQKVSLLNKNPKKYQGKNPCNGQPFIYGIGTDIIEVSRIKSAIERCPGFKTRVYTEREIAFCEDKMAYFMVPRYVEFMKEFPKTPTERAQKFELRKRGIGQAWDREKAKYKLKRELEKKGKN